MSGHSRFMRTTWMLTAKQTLDFGDFYAKVRFLDQKETTDLIDLVRKRNVFARHSWENNFYLQRLAQFSQTTVIEVYRPGDPDETLTESRIIADYIEWLSTLSSVVAISRASLQRKLGITEHRADILDFVIGPRFKYLKSSRRAQSSRTGILIDERFIKRFCRLGFPSLVRRCASSHALSERLRLAIKWLLASRLDPVFEAAVVKTAIALESLLIASDSEPLSRSLSERAAFILGKDFGERQSLARAIKRFYDMRSGIVHGNKRRQKTLASETLEGIDRLILLLCLAIAANSDTIGTMEDLVTWCEECRWGGSSQGLNLPFKPSSIRNALQYFNGT